MSRIVLIDPAYGEPNVRPQLGTLQLAGVLREGGFEVRLLDLSVLGEAGWAKLDDALDGDVLFVGISTVIGSMVSGGIEAAKWVRERRPEVPIVWGGVHPSLEPESTLKHELVDIICINEGEAAVLELARALKEGCGPEGIANLAFKRDGKPVYNPRRTELFDLDSGPVIPYDLVDLSLYRHDPNKTFFGLQGDLVLSLETSRGCVFRCTYCVNAAKQEKFRQKSPERIIAGIEHLVALGVRSIAIVDDNFFIRRKQSRRILEMIVKRGLELELFVAARSDYLAELEDADFELMKAAGIAMLGLGVESGSNAHLRRLNKKETIEATFRASEMLCKHGLKAWYHFLYGFPRETLDDLLATCRAMRKICLENPYAMVNLNQLIPNPGSPSYFECVDAGWESPATLEQWADVLLYTRRKGKPLYMDQEVWDFSRKHLEKVLSFPRNDMPDFDGTAQ